VVLACDLEENQLLRRQRQQRAAQASHKLRRATSMIGIVVVVQATGVVKEGERLDDTNVGAC
jgi:hypothetical protein